MMLCASCRQRTASSVLDQLVQSEMSNCVMVIPWGTENVELFALLILVAEAVPPLGAGGVKGPEVAVEGTAGGKVVAGADIVWDVIYRRGVIMSCLHDVHTIQAL